MKYKLSDLGLKLNNQQLIDFGFVDGVKTVTVDDDFLLVFTYLSEFLEVKAIDRNDDEEYMPFNIDSNRGGISSFLHSKADEEIARLVKQSHLDSVSKEELFTYIEETFSSKPANPFNDVDAMAFRNEFGKWFVLYMTVKADRIYKNRSEDLIEIINIKLPKEALDKSISDGIAHPAYHMNKKYWVSIVLNEVKLDDIKELLMLSYVATGEKGYN